MISMKEIMKRIVKYGRYHERTAEEFYEQQAKTMTDKEKFHLAKRMKKLATE